MSNRMFNIFAIIILVSLAAFLIIVKAVLDDENKAKNTVFAGTCKADEVFIEETETEPEKAVFEREEENEQATSEERTEFLAAEERGQEVFPDVGTETPLEEQTMETKAESTVSFSTARPKEHSAYSVSGVTLDQNIADYLEAKLTEAGIPEWLPIALCQCYQESGFNPLAENGLDKGILQYRITYWDYSRGDIFDWRAQIDRYVDQVANRLKSGLSIEETISRHYTSDYVIEVDAKYVADVLRWYERIEGRR